MSEKSLFINMSEITLNTTRILRGALTNYLITRNPISRPESHTIAKSNAYIGVYRGSVTYLPKRLGSLNKEAELEIILEVNAVSLKNPEEAEAKLSLAEQEILDVLAASRNLGGSVGFIKSFNVEYGLNKTGGTYFQTAIIRLIAKIIKGANQ